MVLLKLESLLEEKDDVRRQAKGLVSSLKKIKMLIFRFFFSLICYTAVLYAYFWLQLFVLFDVDSCVDSKTKR